MSSKSSASPNPQLRKPSKASLPASDVQKFRKELKRFKAESDSEGRKWASAQWGVYAFYDYDGEPIYVGQTNESLNTRLNRHLTNQRTDAVAMRILDVFEVAEVEVWPIWDLEGVSGTNRDARKRLDELEYSAYLNAIDNSRFKAILNEKIPPLSTRVDLPPSIRCSLVDDEMREERGHADIRIARRAETLARLTAVARERGEVSDGLRRVIVIQAVRLAFISAERLAVVEGRAAPNPSSISVESLVGSVLFEHEDPNGLIEDLNDASVEEDGQ